MGCRKTHRVQREYDADLLDLVGDIYQAGLESDRWPEVMKRMSSAFEADLACIYTPSVERPEQAIYLTHNISDGTQAAYSAYYHRLDAWTLSALKRDIYTQGLVTSGEQLVPRHDLHHMEFYHDFLKPNGMEWMISTVLFDGGANRHIPDAHMTFIRHADHAIFEPETVGLIELFAPHVRRALLTHWRLTEARLLQSVHESALDHLGDGLVMLDEDGKVLYMSSLAETFVQAEDGLSIQAGCMHATNTRDNDALRKLIHEACLGIGGSLCVEHSNGHGGHNGGRQPYCLSASPVQESHGLAAVGSLPVATQQGAMLMIHDPERDRPGDAFHLFADHHHITPAESRVLKLLLEDLVPKQIASQLGVAIRTVRTQLSSLYAKTGTCSQRELVKEVMAYEKRSSHFGATRELAA